MLPRFTGALRRIQAVLSGLTLLAAFATAVLAHEGHDHGAPPPAAVTTSSPRVSAQSDTYELVGILRGERLALYLDRFATNESVTDAGIAVSIGGGQDVDALPAPDGTYTVTSPKFAGEGPLELIFAVTAPGGDDLLIGTLQLPARTRIAAPPSSGPSPLQAIQSAPDIRIGDVEVPVLYALAGGMLSLGFLLGLAARSRSRLVPVAGVAVVVLVASTAYAFAHEGHDHGEAKASLPAGDTPRRLPDGTIFVPKPSQRLLDVRTVITKPEAAQKAVSLIGRVIADPNRSGLVQSINGGRVVAPESGLPRLGQVVRRGDVLAMIEQPLGQADRTSLSERFGEIEQEIAVAETRLKRVRQLADRNVAPPSQVTDAEIELEGLRRRREIVR